MSYTPFSNSGFLHSSTNITRVYNCRNLHIQLNNHKTNWPAIVMLRFGFNNFDRFRFDFSIHNSISIGFGLRSAQCTPLLTQLDSCVAAWERQCCGAGHPRSYPPTAAVVVGLNREDVEWAKYRLNSVAL